MQNRPQIADDILKRKFGRQRSGLVLITGLKQCGKTTTAEQYEKECII